MSFCFLGAILLQYPVSNYLIVNSVFAAMVGDVPAVVDVFFFCVLLLLSLSILLLHNYVVFVLFSVSVCVCVLL